MGEEINGIVSWLLRNLPGNTGTFLRYIAYKGKLKSCGKKVIFATNMHIKHPKNLVLGSNVIFGWDVVIDAENGVSIGDWSGIAHGCVVLSKRMYTPDDQKEKKESVTVGNNVWVGANCILDAGITIGNNAIISAGSVVKADVPDYGIAAGNPARVVSWNKKSSESKS